MKRAAMLVLCVTAAAMLGAVVLMVLQLGTSGVRL